MKYLFFDIECSNCFGGTGKMCEFGYVIVDETFKILKKDGLIMSPGNGREVRFDKGIYKREPGFQWAYDYDYYYSCPEFPSFYNKIKSLMTDDVKVMGFAVDNDIRYLLETCERYKLDLFDFEAYETQKLMNRYLPEEKRKHGLQNEFKEVCGVDEYVRMQGHYSRDDAIMTMRIIEEICKSNNCSLEEILEKTQDCKYDALSYYEHYKGNKDLKKNRKINSETWKILVNENTNEGEKYNITGVVKENNEIFNKICEFLNFHNLAISNKIDDSKFLICLDELDIDKMKKVLKTPFEGTYLTVDQLLEER